MGKPSIKFLLSAFFSRKGTGIAMILGKEENE